MRCGSFRLRTCARCQAIASPSRSGSEASRISEAPLAAAFKSLIVDSLPGIVTYSGLKECSTSIPSVLFGKSRTCPIEARISYLPPRNRPSVLALAGDSTMISGFAMSVLRGACHRAAVADYIAAKFQHRQAPVHFLDVKVHHGRQVIMMPRFYPIKQLPNGEKLRILRARIRARTRTRARVYARLRPRACARELGKLIEHVLNRLHQLRPILDQLVDPNGQRILDAARNAKDIATLFGGHARRDQCAASLRRLNHDDPKAEPADDSIAHGKPARQRRRPWLGFGDDRPGLRDRLRQLAVLGWVDPIETGRHHGHRRAASLEGATMSRRVDAPRQPTDDHHPDLREISPQAMGGPLAIRCRTARADDRNHGLRRKPALDVQARRRVVDLC